MDLNIYTQKDIYSAIMTYNFDPDKWLDDEMYMISHQLITGKITQAEYDEMLDALEEKHLQMWRRLDGTYQVDCKPAPGP